MASVTGRLLLAAKLNLATAESCTGGLIGHLMTGVAGSSRYFLGGVISYANSMKKEFLDVSEQLLASHGAVSGEVAEAMAEWGPAPEQGRYHYCGDRYCRPSRGDEGEAGRNRLHRLGHKRYHSEPPLSFYGQSATDSGDHRQNSS